MSISEDYFRVSLDLSKTDLNSAFFGYKNPPSPQLSFRLDNKNSFQNNYEFIISYFKNYINEQKGYYNALVAAYGGEQAFLEKLRTFRGGHDSAAAEKMTVLSKELLKSIQNNETSVKRLKDEYSNYYFTIRSLLTDLRTLASRGQLNKNGLQSLINKISKDNRQDKEVLLSLLRICLQNLKELDQLIYKQGTMTYTNLVHKGSSRSQTFQLSSIDDKGQEIRKDIKTTSEEYSKIKQALEKRGKNIYQIAVDDFDIILTALSPSSEEAEIDEILKKTPNSLYDIQDGKIVGKIMNRSRTLTGNLFEFLVSHTFTGTSLNEESIFDDESIIKAIQNQTGAKSTRKMLVKVSSNVTPRIKDSSVLTDEDTNLALLNSLVKSAAVEINTTSDKIDDYITLQIKSNELQTTNITIAFSDKLYTMANYSQVHLVAENSSILNNLDILNAAGVDASFLNSLVYTILNLSSASELRNTLAPNLETAIKAITSFLEGFIYDLAFNPTNFSASFLNHNSSVLYVLQVGTLIIPSFTLLSPIVKHLETIKQSSEYNGTSSYVTINFSPDNSDPNTLLKEAKQNSPWTNDENFQSVKSQVYNSVASAIARNSTFGLSLNVEALLNNIEAILSEMS